MKVTPKGIEIKVSAIVQNNEVLLTDTNLLISEERYHRIKTHNLERFEDMMEGVESVLIMKTKDWRSLTGIDQLIEELKPNTEE